jgi:hypothetical protein
MATKGSAKEIVNKYLKYTQGEAFLFGKGTFAENKFVWVSVGKDKYVSGEIQKVGS